MRLAYFVALCLRILGLHFKRRALNVNIEGPVAARTQQKAAIEQVPGGSILIQSPRTPV